jgi:hypothetical protein
MTELCLAHLTLPSAQREQVEAVLDGGSTCSDGGSEGYRRALEVPLLVLSQTGMQRG